MPNVQAVNPTLTSAVKRSKKTFAASAVGLQSKHNGGNWNQGQSSNDTLRRLAG